jgi:polysaccharide deacetylase 2 family uncharacterized protein YibQ
MNRRDFLSKAFFLVAGNFLGLNTFFSKAIACDISRRRHQSRPLIALIIDDIGFSPARTRQFLEIGIPITFSILPRLRDSCLLASEIRNMGHEIMLHQPMEPHSLAIDPGPGALYVGYEANQITTIVEDNISSIPFVAGVNNHMGSLFTEHTDKIGEVLKVVKKRNLFFVDSLTSNHSMAYRTARSLHMVSARRSVFLDNVQEEKAILSQLHKLRRCAVRHGRAIGIGHPHIETAKAMRRFVNEFKQPGSFVHVSTLLYS